VFVVSPGTAGGPGSGSHLMPEKTGEVRSLFSRTPNWAGASTTGWVGGSGTPATGNGPHPPRSPRGTADLGPGDDGHTNRRADLT
jgi:hypothetical protein